MTTDTSTTEAVERLASVFSRMMGGGLLADNIRGLAAMARSLAAERDALRTRAEAAEAKLERARDALQEVMQHGRIDDSESRMNKVAAALDEIKAADLDRARA